MSGHAWWVFPVLAAGATAAVGGCTAGGGGEKGTGGATGSTGGFNLQCDEPALGSPLLRRLNRAEYQRTLSAVFPDSEFPGLSMAWQSSLPADAISAYGFDNDGTAVVGPQYAEGLLDTATALATAITSTVSSPAMPCLTTTADQACAKQVLDKYGKRLFRRSLTADEESRYTQFFTSSLAKSDGKTALKWMIVGLIQSPSTVYRSEIGEVDSDGTRHLKPTEIAAELAYTYTGSPPDDSLIAQAESSGIKDPVAWAKQQLATPAGQQALQHFFEAYLAYTQVLAVEKTNIPTFSSVKSDMAAETAAFLKNVIFPAQGTPGNLTDLLTSPDTYPSQALATYYGFPSPASNGAVTRPAGQGIGLLAQGSFLASNAKPDSSSPTHRGLFVFQRLLCETKHNPPPNVPPVASPQPGVKTTRQRYEEHDKNGCTTGCHNFFDPIGFGFEHFDEGGRFRQTENNLPINAESDVPSPDGKTNLFHFHSQEELAKGLAEQEISYKCFSAYLATYAFGSGESCLGSSQVADFYAGKIGIADLFAGLAAAPHFTARSKQ